VGGQANYVLVPYADWNLLKFPDKDQAMEKILDLAILSDIFPTGYPGAVSAGVGVGSTVYIAGAGPVGLAAATSAHLLGAAVVIVGDMNEDRLAQARKFGCETVDLTKGDPAGQIEQILGALGIPGLYVTGDPGGVDEAAKKGSLSLNLGTGWAKSLSFTTGQCPVMRYNRQLMMAILHDRVHIAENVNAKAIPLEEAPKGYAEFDAGAATKYVLDPNGYLS
jgi:glutathione-independent formaldehyde dehydrogenase